MRPTALLPLAVLLLPLAAAAAPGELGGWPQFAEPRRNRCVGAAGAMEPALELEAGAHRYRLEGHRLVQLDKDKDTHLTVGVVSAMKDDREETLAALAKVIARFKAKHADVLVANGDLATNEFELEKVFAALADSGMLVVVVIGNTESCGSFNHTADEVFRKHHNLINGNWVRRLELDDGTLLTVPGYYDRRFTHTGGASTYKPEDLEETATLAKGSPGPLILVSHGPPKMKHKTGIDVVGEGENVGDPGMTELIRDLKISFGIFGHILEAGGRGTNLDGKPLPAKKWHPALYLNAGSINPDPWSMLDKSTSYGMALLVQVDKSKARYEVERMPAP